MAIENFSGRLVTLAEFLPLREDLKSSGKRLVWTNGCFDLLHIGHIVYLQNARSLGDALLVGLNSDRSYRKWKDPRGPVQPENERAQILLALRAVDYVLIFDDPSPLQILQTVQPDIYVKGDDYTLASIDQREREAVESFGGEIAFCSGIAGKSTSVIIADILRERGHEEQRKG